MSCITKFNIKNEYNAYILYTIHIHMNHISSYSSYGEKLTKVLKKVIDIYPSPWLIMYLMLGLDIPFIVVREIHLSMMPTLISKVRLMISGEFYGAADHTIKILNNETHVTIIANYDFMVAMLTIDYLPETSLVGCWEIAVSAKEALISQPEITSVYCYKNTLRKLWMSYSTLDPIKWAKIFRAVELSFDKEMLLKLCETPQLLDLFTEEECANCIKK